MQNHVVSTILSGALSAWLTVFNPGPLPVVSTATFSVGTSWTWDYYEANGQMFSTERYTVIAQAGSKVLIEMASDYRGGQDLKAHHRIEVDVAKCLAAYQNAFVKSAWAYRMFYLDGGRWMPVEQDNTLAFEEKFNCNSFAYAKPSDRYLTVYSEIDGQKAFQQKLWKKLESSWFAIDGQNSGVGVYKDFMTAGERAFSMKLRSSSP